MKAHDSNTEFNSSELNFRISHDGRGTLKMATATGYKPSSDNTGGLTFNYENSYPYPYPSERAFYEPPTTTGSLNSIVSYNQELWGGIGAYLVEDAWLYVGKVLYQLEDAPTGLDSEDIIFFLHDHSP